MRTAWPRSSSTCGVVHAHLSLVSPLPLVGARTDLIPALAPFQLVQNPRSMASYSARVVILPRLAVDASSLSLGTRKPSLARRSGGAPHDLLTRPLIAVELTGCELASPRAAGVWPPFLPSVDFWTTSLRRCRERVQTPAGFFIVQDEGARAGGSAG